MRHPSILTVQFALVLLVIIWGTAYPVVKALLGWLSPMELMLARFWITCLALIPILWSARSEMRRLLRAHPWRLLALALLGVPGYHLSFNLGTRILAADPASSQNAAILASILVATVPAWTALFAQLFRLEHLSGRQWLGQGLALLGVLLIIARGDFSALRPSGGALWVLGAPVSWALYTVIGRPILASERFSLALIGLVVLLGTLIVSPFTPGGMLAHLGALSATAWAQLLFVALLSTFAGYLIWALAIQAMPATRAATAIYFVPVTSVLVSILFFDERLSLLVFLGGVLILGGVILIQRAGASGRDLPSVPEPR